MYSVVDQKDLGDYELVLTAFPGGIHLIGVQKKGHDFTDINQQFTKYPIEKTQYPSQEEIKQTLNSWIRQYGKLYVGSHNTELTRKWRKLLTGIGYLTTNFNHPAAPPDTFFINKTAHNVNWFKKLVIAQSLNEVLNRLSQDPRYNQQTIEKLRSQDPKEVGRMLGIFRNNPQKSFEQLQQRTLQPKTQTTPEIPLSQEEQQLINDYPSIGEWMGKTLLRIKKPVYRTKVYELLSQKASQIKDWADKENKNLANSGISAQDAVNASDKWHQKEIAFNENEQNTEGQVVMTFRDGYTWRKLVSGNSVIEEGKRMDHCVGNYADDVRNKKIEVYSLRDAENNPCVTVGIKWGDIVVQLKGYRDTEPSKYSQYITPFIKNYKYYYEEPFAKPYGLEDVSKKFNNNNNDVPPEWIERINQNIESQGNPPEFARRWCIKTLENGQAPQSWIDIINKRIESKGNPPEFAYGWCKKTLENGQVPQSWINGINKSIESTGYPPGFAHEWYKKNTRK